MSLRASLVITGDAASATAAMGQLDEGLKGNEKAAASAANAWRDADAAIKRLATAQATAKTLIDATKAAYAAGEITLQTYNRELLETKSALSLVSSQHQTAMTALRASSGAMAGATVSAGQQRAAYQNLGRQAQDVAVQLQMGTNIGSIVAMQGGQVADAVAMMGGRFSSLASFLAGPFGAAVIVGAGMLLNQLIPAIFGTTEAMDEGEGSSFRFSSALDVARLSALDAADGMRQLEADIRKTIAAQGDFQRQNAAALVQSAKIRSARIQESEAELAAVVAGRAKPGSFGRTLETVLPSLFGPSGADLQREATLRRQIAADTAALPGAQRAAGLAQMLVTQREVNESLDAGAAATGRYQRELARLNESRQRNIDDPLADGGINDQTYRSELRRITQERDAATKAAREAGRVGRETRGRATSGRRGRTFDQTEFGQDIDAKIARITDQFSDLPPIIARSNNALRQLDDIASDIEKKRPPNYGAIKESLAGAREAIEASLTRPLDDYLEKAGQTAMIDRLILAGKRDQAVALQEIIRLQGTGLPITEQVLATVLKTVTAERERGELLQRQQEMIGNYLDATRSVRSEIEGILAGTGKLSNLPQIFKNLQAKVLAEKLFGPMFRDLDKWVQDDSGMKDATTAYVDSTKETATAAYDLAAAFRAVGGQIREGASAGDGPSAFDQAFADLDPTRAANGEVQTEIVVTAQLPRQPGSLLDVSVDEYMRKMTQGTAKSLTDALNGVAGTQFFSKFTGTLAGAMQGYMVSGGSPFGAALGALKELPGLPKGIADVLGGKMIDGKRVGGAFNGLATGAQIAGLAGAFGIKLNNTGAQIGGAIGGALPIPGGAILGSLAGGLLGNLFGKRPRGAASVTNSGVTGGTNDAALTEAILGQGGDLRATIATIAERLGGTVGSFDVGLGRYKDYYQVSSKAGDPRLGNSYFGRDSRNSLYDGTDPAKAAAAALSEAIRDGAVQGVSARVAKALSANTDVEKAVAEALKVQDLEEMLGGLAGAADKAFASFERQAKERLRIATAYGFDVVKIEELNAKERLKLSKELLEDQVGSLQRLIDDMTGGSLFEGSAVDRRFSLLEQIGKAKAETDAGTEGAADKLAGLLEQLNSVSKDVYGTTGGFAADRGAILDQARDAIARANQRIADAQAKSDPALTKTNAALDENNDQNARLIAIGTHTNELLAGLSRGGPGGSSLALTDMARTSPA